jgi:hypothetical protein
MAAIFEAQLKGKKPLGVTLRGDPRKEETRLDWQHIEQLANAPQPTNQAALEKHFIWNLSTQQYELLKYKYETYQTGLIELDKSIKRDQKELKKAIENYVANGVPPDSAASKADLNFPELDLNIQLKAKYESILEKIAVDPLVTGWSDPVKRRPLLARVYGRLNLALEEIKKLKGNSRKALRAKLCQQILAFSQNYTVFTKGYANISLTGGAGIGKTTAAKIIAAVYKHLGVLVYGNLIDTGPTNFIAGYVGQTATKTNGVLSKSMESVLLIDEAYGLASCDVKKGELKEGGGGFSDEAITQIVNFLSRHRGQCIVIIAGYDHAIKGCFFASNEGLPRRFPIQIKLSNYSSLDLSSIFFDMANKSTAPRYKFFERPHQKRYIYTVVDWLDRQKLLGNQAGDIENLVSLFINHMYTMMAMGPSTDQTLREALEWAVLGFSDKAITIQPDPDAGSGMLTATAVTPPPKKKGKGKGQGRPEARPSPAIVLEDILSPPSPMNMELDYAPKQSELLCLDMGPMVDLSKFRSIGGEIINGQDKYERIKLLGKVSTFGNVYQYSSVNSRKHVAVKFFKRPDRDTEIALVKRLKTESRSARACNIIGAEVLDIGYGGTKQEVVIMNLMNGTLEDYVQRIGKSMNPTYLMNILRTLVETAACLLRNGLVYADYKLANMLYRCNKGVVSVAYGDLGSIHQHGMTVKNAATYPPWESQGGKPVVLLPSFMVWGIGICMISMFAELYPVHVITFLRQVDHSQLPLITDDKFKTMVNQLMILFQLDKTKFNKDISWGQLVKQMLEPDPKKRIKLDVLSKLFGK